MQDASLTPVIVGVGEIKDRPVDRAAGQEPAALIEAALRRAEADVGATLLTRLNSLDVINVVSWRYDDLPALLAERLGAAPRWQRHGEIGGQSPVQFLHEAAARIARGEADVAAICGGEASYTATWARRTGAELGWTVPRTAAQQTGDDWLPARNRDYIHPLARRHGLTEPITVYPLYENATAAAWGQTPAAARAESAALWSALSHVAANNPNAWIRTPVDPLTIATETPDNRMIAWPYPKLMVANPAVNQAAAILLTSLAVARAAGLPDHRLVFLHAGASAQEPRDWMSRPRLDSSPAQEAVLHAMANAAGADGIGMREIYTCFPVVPKMARRVLGLPETAPISVTGGLTFHGAPFNSFMAHAAAAMVRRLREQDGPSPGLLYGQGGHLTAHHAVLLGRRPAAPDTMLRPSDLNTDGAAKPPVTDDPTGPARLETFTVLFDRDGAVTKGVAVLRLPNGARSMATIPADDTATLGLLMAQDRTAIGHEGRLTPGHDGLNRWVA